jgi:hypothetical protein
MTNANADADAIPVLVARIAGAAPPAAERTRDCSGDSERG